MAFGHAFPRSVALSLAAWVLAAVAIAYEGETDPEKLIQDFSERMACKDASVRAYLASEIASAAAAGKAGGEPLRKQAEAMLADESPTVRIRAAQALRALGDAAALPALAPLTATGSYDMLAAAAGARYALKDAELAGDLRKMLLGEDEPQGLAAARWLGVSGDEALCGLLAEAARSERAEVRTRAAFGLGFIQGATGLDALYAILGDKEPRARLAASDAIGRRRDKAGVERLVALLKSEADVEVRKSAANSLGLIADGSALEALLLALEKDGDAGVRAMAATSLGSLGSQAAADGLLASARKDGGAVRVQCLKSLARLCDEKQAPEILGFLKDEDSQIRYAAIGAFGSLRPPGAAELLITAMKSDPDANCRAFAASVLGLIKPEGVEALVSKAFEDKEAVVRLNAIVALSAQYTAVRRPPKPYAEVIMAGLGDTDGTVRAKALLACGRLSLKSAGQKALELLKSDKEAQVREAAAKAVLGVCAKSEGVPALIDALADESDSVRTAAAAELRWLSGKTMGYHTYAAPSRRKASQEAWRAWWDEQNKPPLQ